MQEEDMAESPRINAILMKHKANLNRYIEKFNLKIDTDESISNLGESQVS